MLCGDGIKHSIHVPTKQEHQQYAAYRGLKYLHVAVSPKANFCIVRLSQSRVNVVREVGLNDQVSKL